MSKKFTEEQYQKIVEKHIRNSRYRDIVNDVLEYVTDIGKSSYEEAILLAMPKSREWAHDQFVEKEKKYYWTSKKQDDYAIRGRLYKSTSGSIKLYSENDLGYEDEQLTESEIMSWGYNPEMFDKEEV